MVTKALLLDYNLHVVKSPIIHDMVRGLKCARSSLVFVNEGAILPRHLTLEKFLLIFQSNANLTPIQELSLVGILKHHDIRAFGDLWDGRPS